MQSPPTRTEKLVRVATRALEVSCLVALLRRGNLARVRRSKLSASAAQCGRETRPYNCDKTRQADFVLLAPILIGG
jgi:hypothetical protein